MFLSKENQQSNRSYSKENNEPAPFYNALSEITEKAAKVRSLLERKHRDDTISNLISISNNELASLNSIKVELINKSQQSLDKIVNVIEEKLGEIYRNSEIYIRSNIDRNIQVCREIVKSNSNNLVETFLSNIQILLDKSYFQNELNIKLKEQNNFIQDLILKVNESVDEKNNQITQTFKEYLAQHEEKSKSVYLSQLSIIQKQYELIIRDLRKRNLLLEHDLENRVSLEKQLNNRIELMNKEIVNLSTLSNSKDIDINSLKDQVEYLNRVNLEQKNNNNELIKKNEDILNKFMYKLEISRKKYLFYGNGINVLNHLLKNLIIFRKRETFEMMKNFNLEIFNSNCNINSKETEKNSIMKESKLSTIININKESLFGLLDVEKRIKEQEREQSLINSLLGMVCGRDFNQLIIFARMLDRKRFELIKKTFHKIKMFKFNSENS